MVCIWRLSLSVHWVIFFISNSAFSKSNPNANQKYFNGYCTDNFNQCQHVCVPNPTNLRQYYCTCRNGNVLQHDGFSCNKTPPKDLEMKFEINSGSVDEKQERFVPKIPGSLKKSTKLLISRAKRYTDGKSKTLRPVKGLPKGTCTANSCKNGGVCQTMKSSTTNDFVISCLCRLGFEGVTCEGTNNGVKFPKFLNGYLAFPEQILNDLNFRLSLYVRPANDSQADTVIAFKQSLKNINFILGLEQKHFIFRIENGKLQKKFQHQTKVEYSRNKWYKIEIERKHNDAKLSVDDVESTVPGIELRGEDERYIENKNDSNFASNNFICDYCLYFGGHPQLLKTLQKNFNLFGSIENGFIGCMRNLMIDEVDTDMRRTPYYGKAVDGLGIEDCSTFLCDSRSSEIKCQNMGECHVSDNFVPTCLCRFGFTGTYCEQEIKIELPSFTGDSFANYKGLKGTSRSQNDIFIKFKPVSGTGLLLYQGYSSDKRGDFLALYLINGYSWVSYDLGSGTISMRSQKSLKLDEWHTIRFFRVGRQGNLIVDYDEPVVGFSPGSQLQLTITQNLQLGGVDSFDNVSASVSIKKGFQGCIHMLFVDNTKINLIEDIFVENSKNIQNCNNHQCGQYRKICWKVSECIPDEDRYLCSCPLGYIEETCQTEIDISGIRQPSFNGSSYLAYNNTKLLKKFSNAQFTLTITVNLKIIQKNRIFVQMISKSDINIGPYFTLKINSKSGIDLDLNNGVDKIMVNIIDHLPLLSDHRIQIIKDESSLRFVVNDSYVKDVKLQYKSLSKLGFSRLFLGGTDLPNSIRQNLPLQSGIVGCLRQILLDNQVIRVTDAFDGRSVTDCSSRYSTHPESLA